jgi:hypothetical protein
MWFYKHPRFFHPDIFGAAIPSDAVEVSDEEHEALMQAQRSRGASIEPDQNGRPVAVDPAPLSLGQVRAMLLDRIDRTADAARLAVAGDPLRAAEYQIAQAEAKTFAAAGYAGDVPMSVKSWAEAKQWTAKQAAENIIAEAAAWNGALYAIRDVRLKAKEQVRNALTAEAAEEAADIVCAAIAHMVQNLGNAKS